MSSLAARASRFIPGAAYPAIAGFLQTALVARVLPAEGLGQFAAALAIVAIVSAAGAQWIAQPMNRFLADDVLPAEAVAAARRATGVAMLAVGGVTTVAAGLHLHGWPSGLVPDGFALAVGLTAGLGSAAIAILAFWQSRREAQRYARFQLIYGVARLAASVAVAAWVGNATSALAGVAAGAAMAVALEWKRLPTSTPASVDPTQARIWMRRLWLYGSAFIPWSVCSVATSVSDRLVISHLLGDRALGLYAAQYTLAAGAAYAVGTPLLLYLHPEIMRVWGRGDHPGARRLLRSAVSLLAAGLAVVWVATWFLRAPITRMVFGAEYVEVATLLPWLCVGTGLWQIALCVQKPLEADDRTWTLALFMLMAAIVNVGANVLLLPVAGLSGAVAATVLAYSVYLLSVLVADRQDRWAIAVAVILMVGFGAWTQRDTALLGSGLWLGLAGFGLAGLVPAVALRLVRKPTHQSRASRRADEVGDA